MDSKFASLLEFELIVTIFFGWRNVRLFALQRLYMIKFELSTLVESNYILVDICLLKKAQIK